MAISDLIYSPTGLPTLTGQLYEELQTYFELEAEVAGQTLLIDIAEPVGWDQVKLIHRRSKEYHGFTSEYLTSDIELTFDCPAGYSFINDRYEANGSDAEIIFRTGVIYQGEKHPEFESKLDLNLYQNENDQITCTALRKSVSEIINNRNDTQLDFLEAKDLDSNSIPPLVPETILLHSQAITEKFAASIKEPQEADLFKSKDGTLYIQFPTDEPSVTQIKESFGQPIGISELNPLETGNCLIKFAAGGLIDISLHFSLSWTFKMTPRRVGNIFNPKNITSYRLEAQILQKLTTGQVNTFSVGTPLTGAPNNKEVYIANYALDSYRTTLKVNNGDELYVLVKWSYEHNANDLRSSEGYVTVFDFGIDITAKTESASSTCQGFLVGNVLERAIQKMTGKSGLLRSNFYSLSGDEQAVAGCGANRIIASGALIRQTPIEKAKMPTSWKEVLDSLVAIDGIGVGWEQEEGFGETIRIEPREYFYQNKELLALDGVGEYKLEVAKEYLPNKLTVGYTKYQDEKETQLDEINGEHEYATPIRTNKLDLELRSKLIASGILIELTRRAQWKEDSTDSSTYDDEPFIIDVTGASAYSAHMIFVPEIFIPGTFDLVDTSRIVQVDSMVFGFTKGQTVVFSGVGANAGIYTLVEVGSISNQDGQYGYLLTLDRYLEHYDGIGEFYLPGTTLQALRDEPFKSVYGTVDSSSTYNLLLTPKRMMLANSSWLAGMGAYKPSDRPFKATRVRYNNTLRTVLKEEWLCERGDVDKLEVEEGADLELIRLGDPLFVPEWITFTCDMKVQQVRRLFNALRGLDEGSNYGYISVKNNQGKVVTGWPYEIEFDPTNGKANFKLLRRFEVLGFDLEQACADFANYTFDDWTAKYPGVSIERCRFNNFE
ncbi:hypothetical protein [Siphonobacter sp.]|uniref:hypothetical protein n=1 Tax=Siphonobacter sp. TaxID=1869184 RepID=UPI003B3B69D7